MHICTYFSPLPPCLLCEVVIVREASCIKCTSALSQEFYTDSNVYLPGKASELFPLFFFFLPSCFGKGPVGWMRGDKVHGRQFILRLYHYIHLRKQTAWKQIKKGRERRKKGAWERYVYPSCLQLYIEWIKQIMDVCTVFDQLPSKPRGLAHST